MSHLTDGQLHAYLDGSVEALDGATLVGARSHVAACDDCSARLEAARLVRDEAVSLLGTAAPASYSPPPFEELKRRAALVDSARDDAGEPPSAGDSVSARQTGTGRLFRRPGSLAWAASLAVALTAGWLVRGTVGTGSADRPSAMAPSETVALLEKKEASALDQSVDQDAAESLEQSAAGVGGDEERFRVTLRSTELPSELKEGRSSGAAPPPEFSRERTEPQEEEADRPKVDRAAAKMAQSDVAGLPSAGRGSIEGPADWQPVRREQAEALLGGALKTVEGLPILSVYARSAGAVPEVWTAQQLSSGHQLNLRQTPLEGRFGDLEKAGAADGRNESATDPVLGMEARPQQQAYYETLQSLFIDGYLIEATAPLAADSLRALLSRLKD